MFKNIENGSDFEIVQLCRLCLAEEENLIHIFNPKGYQGFLLWEIIEEILQMEVSKKDGLPWTICERCISKVTEFKHFKTTCIKSKISLLTMIANRGSVVNVKEDVDADESLSDVESSGEAMIHWMKGSTCTGVSSEDAALSDPLDLIGVKKDPDAGDPLLAVISNQENVQSIESLDVGALNVVCIPLVMGECPTILDKEEDPWESPAGEETNGGDDPVEDYSRVTSVTNIVSVPQAMDDMVDGCSIAGGSTKLCEEIVSELREGRNKNIAKKFERKTSLSTLPGEHSLKTVEKFSDKKGESLKWSDCTTSALKLNDMKPSERRHLDSRKKQLAQCTEFICGQCGVKHTDKKKLLIHVGGHISRNRPSTCAMPEISSLKCIQSSVTGIQSSKEFKCKMCGKEFKRKSWLTRHYVVHSNLKPFKCDTCGNVFKRKHALLKHSKIHLDSTLFKCDCCGKGQTSMSALARHLLIHSGFRPFKCDRCGKGFAQKSNLDTHLVMHSSLRLFMCDTCGKGFARKSNLVTHSVIHSGLKPFTCDTCGKGFAQKANLDTHSVIHCDLKPYKCDTCGKGFKRKNNLCQHLVIHSDLKPFMCDTCGKGFARKSKLDTHSVIHSDLKPYKCDTCGKGFKRKMDLCQHLVIHSGLKPFRCDTCGRGFTQKGTLAAHSVMHSSLRPFKCQTCGKEFRWRAGLRRHSIMHS